jgi:hypothetical protein
MKGIAWQSLHHGAVNARQSLHHDAVNARQNFQIKKKKKLEKCGQ